MEEQKYCVVATKRGIDYNRIMITGPLSQNKAYEQSDFFQSAGTYKRLYRYFKVAKYPFKEIKPKNNLYEQTKSRRSTSDSK